MLNATSTAGLEERKPVLVAITGFGSVWRHRLARQRETAYHFTQAVYFNTTGVVVNGNVRQRSKICGYARFDVAGGFDPHHLLRMTHRVFECAEPSVWKEWNRLQFRRLLHPGEQADRYLVIARSDLIGRFQIGDQRWRSPESWILSFSENSDQQEAMLLIGPQGWIESDLGRFVLRTPEQRACEGRLVLLDRS